jgi:hypothetical protein
MQIWLEISFPKNPPKRSKTSPLKLGKGHSRALNRISCSLQYLPTSQAIGNEIDLGSKRLALLL